MDKDLTLLQNISDSLKTEPLSDQRTLAKNANISLGLMNAVLGRFVERGWIMLTNVNARKLAYAITPAGVAELSKRSKDFAKRNFALASQYNEVLSNLIQKAKIDGKQSVVLYGKSYIRFLIAYTCEKLEMKLVEKSPEEMTDEDLASSLCIIGELEEDNVQEQAIGRGCLGLLEVLDLERL